MDIINFLKSLFSGKKASGVPGSPVNSNYLARWEKEREERMVAAEAVLKDWIIKLLTERNGLPFSWESGSDEAFVTFEGLDDSSEDIVEDLQQFIIDKLEIPDAGEFEMNGKGTIYLENNLVRVKYSSIMKAIVDFNEETEEEVFSDEELDSGDQVLFAI